MVANFYIVHFMRIAGILRLNFRKMQKVVELTWIVYTNELHSHAQVLIQLEVKYISSYITCS